MVLLAENKNECGISTCLRRRRLLLEVHNLAADMFRVVNDILQAKGLLLRAGTAVDATSQFGFANLR